MILWLILGAMLFLAVMMLVWPLLRPAPEQMPRDAYDLEIYRDREFASAENPNDVNYFWDMSLSFPINDTSRWSSIVAYLDTPQLISQRQNFRINNLYTKQLKFFNNRNFLVSFGNSYQRNRFPTSPTSETDRYGLRGGLRFSPFKDFSYFLDYNYTWVDEKFTGETITPSALTMGANYSREITDTLYSNFSVDYRNESNAESILSFLSGEDSLSTSAGLTYNPSSGYSIFMDTRLRFVDPENPQRPNFVDADLRFGVRLNWDTFFRWDPSGVVAGSVYKDQNGNDVRDSGEPGISDVKIDIGNSEYLTNDNGEYYAKVRAKKVRVALDVESLPQGFLVSTELSKDVVIEHRKTSVVDFAVTTRSGIYGVVYYDKNRNNKLDPDDVLIPKVTMILDGVKEAESDGSGSYAFDKITPGEHTIKIDVNSISLEYVPSIKVTDEVNVVEGMTVTYHVPLKKASK